MKCPHCHKEFHPQPEIVDIGEVGRDKFSSFFWKATKMTCPACEGPIIFLDQYTSGEKKLYHRKKWMVFPRGANRPPAPPEVPEEIANDFNEACLVLTDSPQASAALSRRCLQHLLRERDVSSNSNLSKAIDDALESNLPSHISDNLDAIRNIGNFAAHPQKSLQSGEILPVEPHEADWNLDVLEMLFDFYYVQPAKSADRREALNKKLKDAGKTPMKSPSEANNEGQEP